jgi:hypothetical protein
MTYQVGNRVIAYLVFVIPVVTSGILWLSVGLRRASYRRRFQGWRFVWEMWLSTALLTMLLFGGFYWYLFWRPFYSITVPTTGTLVVQYMLPAREVQIETDDIRAVRVATEPIPLRRDSRRQYVQIELANGRTLISAPTASSAAADLHRQLDVSRHSMYADPAH